MLPHLSGLSIANRGGASFARRKLLCSTDDCPTVAGRKV
jgi:hypothetical protein